jgi:hypothetical protein
MMKLIYIVYSVGLGSSGLLAVGNNLPEAIGSKRSTEPAENGRDSKGRLEILMVFRVWDSAQERGGIRGTETPRPPSSRGDHDIQLPHEFELFNAQVFFTLYRMPRQPYGKLP